MVSPLTKRQFVLADALQAKRDIELATNVIKNEREKYEQDVIKSAKILEKQNQEVKELESALENSIDTTVIFCNTVKELHKDYIETIKKAAEVLDLHLGVINDLNDKIDIQKGILSKIEEEKLRHHEEIVREATELIQMKTDLDIYKSRLEKEILESGSGIKVIL